MIVGGPARKLSRDVSKTFQPVADQLQLPWLCPALYKGSSIPSRPSFQRRSTATTSSRRPLGPVRANTSPATPISSAGRERRYANAAPSSQPASNDDFYVPIVSDAGPAGSRWPVQMPEYDPSTLLKLNDPMSQFNKNITTARGGVFAHNVDLGDYYSTIEACLAVGMYDRAAAFIRNVTHGAKDGSLPELLALHNFYLGHLIGQFSYTEDSEILATVQRWFHMDMIKQDVQPNAQTYALVFYAAIRDSNRSQAGRNVRRLAWMAKDADMIAELQEEMSLVLSEEDYDEVLALAPGVFQPPTRPENEVSVNDGRTNLHAEASSHKSHTEVLSTDQSGHGLDLLKKALSAVDESRSKTPVPDMHTNEDLLRRQRILEDHSQKVALEGWKLSQKDMEKRGAIHSSVSKRSVQQLIWRWHERLVPLLKKYIEDESRMEPHSKMTGQALPFLSMVETEDLSMTVLCTFMNSLSYYKEVNISIARCVIELADEVETLCAKKVVANRQANRWAKNADKRTAYAKQVYAMHKHLFPPGTVPKPWSKILKVRIGSVLLQEILKVATLPARSDAKSDSPTETERPAVTHEMEFRKGKRRGVLRRDDALMKMLASEPSVGSLSAEMPMLVPAKPWTGIRQGGFLSDGNDIARLNSTEFQCYDYMQVAIERGDMNTVLRSLDVLGSTAFKVNDDVLHVMTQVWNTGEKFGKIVQADPKFDLPDPISENASLHERVSYKQKLRDIKDKLAGMHSNRCFQNFQLETARAFAGEKFYLPHSLDFRGRAYPIPNYLNQMGADNCRGLLMFGEGKRLGEQGLFWLKVHLANVYGEDKLSLGERSQFADEHLDDILDSANDPLGGRRWWASGEHVWQCLAACIELRNALRLPNPEEYICHLPAQQDGSCNGLQHYAALGGDPIGARQVNLEPSDRPSDVYTAVADRVSKRVDMDAADGVECALKLQGRIVRKVVKQTVMTTVYGVTFAGGVAQIAKQLRELYPPELWDTHSAVDNSIYMHALYIAKHVFAVLGDIFNGATALQKWLLECGEVICTSVTPEQVDFFKQKELLRESGHHEEALGKLKPGRRKKGASVAADELPFKSTIIWTTPLRMPVVQPYRKPTSRRVSTAVQELLLDIPTSDVEVSKRKQLQAFAPNFIHSLDASHMHLSAIACKQAGLTFAMVHDSYWCHPSDVDSMNRVLRDAFVRMHQDDIVGRLAAEFRARYEGHMRIQKVPQDSALGKRIMQLREESGSGQVPEISTPTYLKRAGIELGVEARRRELLASEDEELRRRGEEMLTPTRLWLEASKEDKVNSSMPDLDTAHIWQRDRAVNGLTAAQQVELEASKLSGSDIAEALSYRYETADHSGSGADSEFDPSEQNDCADDDVDAEAVASVNKTVKRSKGGTKKGAEEEKEWDKEKYSEPYVKWKKATTIRRQTAGKERASRTTKYVRFWVPVEFPPTPEKGSWDLTRVRESTYFFS